MTRIIIAAISCISNLAAFGQNPEIYSGTNSEKVGIRLLDSSLIMIEDYNPPRRYKMVLTPVVIKFTFNGKEKIYRCVKPAYWDENKSLVFLVKENESTSIWMLLVTPDGDKPWPEIDESMKVMRGYYLK